MFTNWYDVKYAILNLLHVSAAILYTSNMYISTYVILHFNMFN